MNTNRSVRVKDIVEKFQMEVINKGTDYDTEILTITDVNRPGLQFIGFFDSQEIRFGWHLGSL